jgi:plasmid replication initiation protein
MQDKGDHGRDNMNLSEVPITLLADRVPKGVGTLVFKTDHGQLVVTGSCDYGLPTASDGDIIIGLIYLTKRANDFTNSTVNFTKYELLDLLRWKKDGKSYQRVEDGLQRWLGVTLRYEGCWYDNTIKRRVDAGFHILESVISYDGDTRKHAKTMQKELPFNQFTWNKLFFESCQANYIKRLDTDVYFGLKSAISRQMFRFLDKRLYVRNTLTFDLRTFAFDHVGLSRNYIDKDLRKKLQVGFDELHAIGFIKSATFDNPRRGEWSIRIVGKGRIGRDGTGAGGNATSGVF